MKSKSKFWQYFKAYNVADIVAMIKNNGRDPAVYAEPSKGKWVIITGATSGIGYVTAKKFASMGVNLLCVNRNIEKSKALKKEIEEAYQVICDYKIADLSILEEIHRVADELHTFEADIDAFIHNAGVYLTKKEITEDGLEKVFVVHHLSSFIINYKLFKKLNQQDSARIILVSSEGHRFAPWGLNLEDLNFEKSRYSGLKSYGNAKLAQLLCMIEFKKKITNDQLSIIAMHPGAVKSDTGQENGAFYKWYKRNILDKILKSADLSAEALYYLSFSPELKGQSGKFYNLTTEEKPTPPALDEEVAEDLWRKSMELAQL